MGGVIGFITALHLLGWGIMLVVVAPRHLSVGSQAFGAGIGLTAYLLGVRHAFDADHIAAIDNTTRKLMTEGQRPLTVGFWFSLGHSSVVFGLGVALSAGVRAIIGTVSSGGNSTRQLLELVGLAISGVFLLIIGVLNLVLLVGIVRVFRRMRHGAFDEAELNRQLDQRGALNRILGRATRAVSKPWHMYLVGLLFGLGFDTASEVALLVLAGTSTAAGLPWYAIVCLPLLFAAGMSLFDTADGTFMNFAYGWAFSQPVRKVFYNMTVTGLSVAVALLIGGVELVQLLADRMGWTTGIWSVVGHVDINTLGFFIAGGFVVTWLVAWTVWRVGRVEQRWSGAMRTGGE